MKSTAFRFTALTTILHALAHAPPASARLQEPHEGRTRRRLRKDVPLPLPSNLKNPLHHPPPPKTTTPTKKDGADDVGIRIVGGEPVSGPEVYPFFVSWDGSCGGSLIHPDIVLTAAHCSIIESNTVTIDAFALFDSTTPGAVTRTILERSGHPGYVEDTVANDFMLLHLSEVVTSVAPIELNDENTVPSAGQNLTVIGLGTTSEGGFQADTLQQVTVKAVSDEECNDNYSGNIIEDIMFCAGVEGGGKDSCQGDSGGPIFTVTESGVGKQVGVVSWGFGCAQPEFPGVYAEISAVNDWILSEICRMSADKPTGCPDPTPVPSPGPGEAMVSVEIFTDQYPFEVSWELLDDTGAVVGSVEAGTYTIAFQNFVESFFLEIGSQYTFVIEDTANDGLCCLGGDGMWSVTAGDLVLASGASYGASDSASFIVPQQGSTVPPTPPPSTIGSDPSTPSPTPPPTTPSSEPITTPPPTSSSTHGGSNPSACEDTSGTFFVDSDAGDKTCDWLGDNLVRYGYLCQFVDVAIVCPSTCDWCSLFFPSAIEADTNKVEEPPTLSQGDTSGGDTSAAQRTGSLIQTAVVATVTIWWLFS